MKNFVMAGHTVPVTAPYAVASGGGCLVGSLFGVAPVGAGNGEELELNIGGVYDMTAETHATDQAFAIGDLVYWDNTNKRMTKTASGNTKVGVAVAAKVSTAGTVRVRLNPSF